MKWLLIFLSALPLANAAPVSLFDGKTLAGWEMPAGEEKWWQAKDEMIVGGSLEEKVPTNLFLSSVRVFRNFELTFKIRLVKGEGFMNSGMQVRSARDAGKSPMSGYQVDAGIGYWGDLYDEHRREKKLTGPVDPAALAKVVKDWEWNDYRIVCEGRRIRSWINGQPALDFTEADAAIPLDGKFSIQVHAGGTLLVQLSDITINELPDTPGAPSWTPAKPEIPQPKAEGSTAKTPEQERQCFVLPEGFVAELVASEVQGVGKPITMAWDEIPGNLGTEMTYDFPALVTPAEAAAAAAKFAKFRVMTEKPGNPAAGRATFQATCMICHQVKGVGMQIGPDLSGVGAMGVQGILRNVLDPNAQLESGYYRHDVSLTDGSLVSGFLVEETKDSITIRPVGADPKVIPRALFGSHTISKRSLMPEGLIEGFSEKQVADLFTYLTTLR